MKWPLSPFPASPLFSSPCHPFIPSILHPPKYTAFYLYTIPFARNISWIVGNLFFCNAQSTVVELPVPVPFLVSEFLEVHIYKYKSFFSSQCVFQCLEHRKICLLNWMFCLPYFWTCSIFFLTFPFKYCVQQLTQKCVSQILMWLFISLGKAVSIKIAPNNIHYTNRMPAVC